MDFNTSKFVKIADYSFMHKVFNSERLVKYDIEHLKQTISSRQGYGHTKPKMYNTQERKTWDFDLNDPKFADLLGSLNEFILKANDNYQFDLTDIISLHYMEYSSENSLSLDWHYDLGSMYPYNTRKISFSLMVNGSEEYEGGELEIQTTNTINPIIQIPKSSGSIAFFPSYLRHRVTPVTKGIRKVIVGFVGGKPFR